MVRLDVDWKAIKEKPPYVCGKCKYKALLNAKYDAYYCLKCNRWTEPKCADKSCESCAHRPRWPLKRK